MPIGGTEKSNAKISTEGLGPRIVFLLTFNYNGQDVTLITHYAHSMGQRKTCGLIGNLIQMIDFIRKRVLSLIQSFITFSFPRQWW